MSWRIGISSPRVAQSSRHWRRIGAATLIGLALAVAACGSTTGGGGPPTPTAKPPTATATPVPVPCSGWRTVGGPTAKYPNSRLSAVSALSPTDAWAVGSTYLDAWTPTQGESLIERWDGSAWHIVVSAGPSHGSLAAITAISPTDVWAVGSQADPAVPLAMHWNGTAWSVVPSPSPSGAWSSWLRNVVAITAQDVWAFGGQYSSPPDQQPSDLLVEHWNGASWQIVSSPPLPATSMDNGGYLTAAARIPGTNQLWAVGAWHPGVSMGPGDPLIERWDGSAWQIVPSPALPKDASGGGWSGVVALSASNAWVVGSYGWLSTEHPLIAHWDGTRWRSVVADPNTYGSLDSVAASGANDVRAAGLFRTEHDATTGTGQTVPLIEQWDGTTWQIATFPKLPSVALFVPWRPSIATDGAGNYWAVGSYAAEPTPNQYHELPFTLHCP